jgi:hypothetical protein
MFRNRPQTLTLLGLTTFALAGCAGGEDEDKTRAVDDGVFGDQVQTLDRAQGVEEQLQDAAAAQRKALEEQER